MQVQHIPFEVVLNIEGKGSIHSMIVLNKKDTASSPNKHI